MANELTRLDPRALANYDSVDGQMELFKRFNLSPTMIETHRFEKRGDHFALVKRPEPVSIFDDGAENRRVVNGMRQTYAERVGLNNGRGKYNDENKLFDQDSASLKVGEVDAWSTI